MTVGFLVTAETDPYGIAVASRCWESRPTAYERLRCESLIESAGRLDADPMIVGHGSDLMPVCPD